jgi:DNA-binding NarL/FixJ family response regulator
MRSGGGVRASGYEVVGRSDDANGLLGLVEEQRPDLAIVDIRMPPTHTTEGLDAARPLEELSPREREVLALTAEGRSNAGIAQHLWVTEGTVEKHVHSILRKLRLPETEGDHRRVLAVLTFLETR